MCAISQKRPKRESLDLNPLPTGLGMCNWFQSRSKHAFLLSSASDVSKVWREVANMAAIAASRGNSPLGNGRPGAEKAIAAWRL